MPCMCRAPCAVHLHAIHEYRPKCILLYLPKSKMHTVLAKSGRKYAKARRALCPGQRLRRVCRESLRTSGGSRVNIYIVRRSASGTGSPSDEIPWLPNKEMTKLCEVSDETSTNLFPHL